MCQVYNLRSNSEVARCVGRLLCMREGELRMEEDSNKESW